MGTFINIGFLEIRWLDILDIILVSLLIYQLYKLVKGSLAFNIFVGLLFIYIASLIVRALNMKLLAGILGQFIDVGVIALLIVFQPEVRRFLLFIGRGNILKKESVWKKFLNKSFGFSLIHDKIIKEITIALKNLTRTKTGALIIFAKTSRLQHFANTGINVNANVNSKLLESIFFLNNPLHDGAVIIADDKILAASCILPISESPNVPSHVGTRHRAGMGIAEISDSLAIIVSQERGQISYALEGKLELNKDIKEIEKVLEDFYVNI